MPCVISMKRNDRAVPWGFRLQGGTDFRIPLSIKKVSLIYSHSLLCSYHIRKNGSFKNYERRGKKERMEKTQTSLTEFRQQMRSGDLLAYLSLKSLFNGIVSCFLCSFVQIQPRNTIFQKFNSCVTDRRTDGPTDGRTYTASYRDARTHLKKIKEE